MKRERERERDVRAMEQSFVPHIEELVEESEVDKLEVRTIFGGGEREESGALSFYFTHTYPHTLFLFSVTNPLFISPPSLSLPLSLSLSL